MTFLWIDMLWFLLAAPLLVRAYFELLRRRKKIALRFPEIVTIRQSLDKSTKIKRHIPPALLLVSFCLLVVATARPATVMTLTSPQGGTIIMAMDVSGSMRSGDVAPDRISAARTAAKTFVDERDPRTHVGVVAFSDAAYLVQAPTTDTHMLDEAIASLQPQMTTAIGAAVVTSLKAIFPPVKLDGLLAGLGGEQFTSGASLGQAKAKPPSLPPVPPGSYGTAVIVLMTDGRNTTGPDPVEAARVASNLGVRIFTIGFGTSDKSEQKVERQDITMILDEPTLKRMADITKGQYFHAQSAEELTRIYKQVITTVTRQPEETEITFIFVAAAAVVCALASLLSKLWYHRLF